MQAAAPGPLKQVTAEVFLGLWALGAHHVAGRPGAGHAADLVHAAGLFMGWLVRVVLAGGESQTVCSLAAAGVYDRGESQTQLSEASQAARCWACCPT